MALVLADRVKETTTTTGTGTYTLAGASDSSFETFASIGDANTTYYACTDGSDFEVGIGTYTASGTTLARTTILQSSNSDAAVNWGAGTKDIFCTQPAEKAVYLDASGNIEAFNASNLTALNASNLASGTVADARLPGTISSDITGNAASATALETGRNFSLTGDVTASAVSFDGTGNVALSTTIAANSVALGTDTTGNYVASLVAGNLIDLQNNSGESATPTIDVNLSELTTSTADGDGDFFAVVDAANAQKKLTKANIALSGFNNDSGFITSADGGNAATLDGLDSTQFLRSDAADTKTSGDLTFSDNVKAIFGTDGDAELYFDNANSDLILNMATDSDFMVMHGTEKQIVANNDSTVELYSDGSVKLSTDSNGITVYGYLNLAGTNGDRIIFEGDTSDDNETTLIVTDPTADRTITLPDASGTVLLDTGNQTLTGDLTFPDNEKAVFGTGDDLSIYHDGTDSYVSNKTGDLYIGANDTTDVGGDVYLRAKIGENDTSIRLQDDSGIVFYSNGSITMQMYSSFLYIYDNTTLQFADLILNGGDVVFDSGTYNTTITPTTATAARTLTLPDATGTVQLTDGSGANLTSLNASQLSSGTVPNDRLDAQLQDVAGLAVTNGGFIVGDGSNFVLETEGTARTSLGLGTSAVLDTGISNTNVPKFTTGVADDDFLRVAGTAIEGRSASEVLSDIGGQASLTFGISNTNAVKVDSTSVADDEYARFTANGLESRSTSEVLSDIGAITASSTDTLTNKTINASQLSGTVADARLSSAVLTTSNSDAPSTTTAVADADFVLIDDGGTMKRITPANLGVPSNQDYGLVTGSVTGTEDYGSVA